MAKKKETELPKAVTTEEWEVEQRTQAPTEVQTKEEIGRYLPENIYNAIQTYLQSRPIGEASNLYNTVQRLQQIKVNVVVSAESNGN